MKFVKKLGYFADQELDIYTEMGKFKSIDANTVECNGVQFTCNKSLGVVAAGNFLDKRLHWYDPSY